MYTANRILCALVVGLALSGPGVSVEASEPKNWFLASEGGPDDPGPRNGHAMAFDRNRQVVVLFGGALDGAYYGDTWEWDGCTWELKSAGGPSDPNARNAHAMAYDGVNGIVP